MWLSLVVKECIVEGWACEERCARHRLECLLCDSSRHYERNAAQGYGTHLSGALLFYVKLLSLVQRFSLVQSKAHTNDTH